MIRFVAEELSTSHWFDITTAKTELGYVPTIRMEEGFKRLQAWLETNVAE
jgi:2-alkyl-3-oxoalkanoate reductase